MSSIKYKTGILLLLFGILISVNSCKNEDDKAKKQKLNLEAVPVEINEYNQEIHSIGRTARKSEIKLSFKTPGIIKQINVDEGDKVRKGQILASLNLTELNSMRKQAEIAFEKAQRDFNRAENLYKDSVATLEQYQNAKSSLNAAEAQLKIANFNIEHSIIKAPATGQILKKLSEPKEMIAAGYPVFLFGSSDEAWILTVNLIAEDMKLINIDDNALIKFENDGKVYKAVVSEISTFADPYTATFEVELKFINPPADSATGMIAKAKILSSNRNSYIKIPASSVIEANKNLLEIYVYSNDSLQRQTVKLINSENDYLLIESELDTNSFIISKGAHYIKNNTEFEVEIKK